MHAYYTKTAAMSSILVLEVYINVYAWNNHSRATIEATGVVSTWTHLRLATSEATGVAIPFEGSY